MRDFAAFVGNARFLLQLLDSALLAQLHAHARKQFRGLPGRRENVVRSEFEGASALRCAAPRKKDDANSRSGSTTLDFR